MEAQSVSYFSGLPILLVGLVVVFMPIIIAFRKKHSYKVPIIIINVASLLTGIILARLVENEEIARNSQVILGVVVSLMWLSALSHRKIKNKICYN